MSIFAKRHYEFLARVCGELTNESAEIICNALEDENDRFQADKFMRAVNVHTDAAVVRHATAIKEREAYRR